MGDPSRARTQRSGPARVIVPRKRGSRSRVRLRVPIARPILLAPPAQAQMRPECVLASAGRQMTGVADSDATNEGMGTCAP